MQCFTKIPVYPHCFKSVFDFMLRFQTYSCLAWDGYCGIMIGFTLLVFIPVSGSFLAFYLSGSSSLNCY